MLTLEQTLDQIAGASRAEYHKLVIEAVEHPEVEIAKERIVKVLADCGKSSQQLRDDIERVRQRYDADVALKQAEREVAERCPDLDQRGAAAQKRFEKVRDDMLRKLHAAANEAKSYEYEAHRLRMAARVAQQNRSTAFARTMGRSARERMSAQDLTDWRAIDLFASDEVPVLGGKLFQQQPSTTIAVVRSMSNGA